MWGSEAPDLPETARTVVVLASAGAGSETCAALGGRGERVLLVEYGDLTAAGMRERLADRFDDPPPVRSLGLGVDVEHGDLTTQEIAIAETLSPGTAVCLDSFGVLFQYADREPVFQFVHSLAERCAEASATMHFHLDPAAVEDQSLAALTTLMDAAVRVDDASVEVRPELTEKD